MMRSGHGANTSYRGLSLPFMESTYDNCLSCDTYIQDSQNVIDTQNGLKRILFHLSVIFFFLSFFLLVSFFNLFFVQNLLDVDLVKMFSYEIQLNWAENMKSTDKNLSEGVKHQSKSRASKTLEWHT